MNAARGDPPQPFIVQREQYSVAAGLARPVLATIGDALRELGQGSPDDSDYLGETESHSTDRKYYALPTAEWRTWRTRAIRLCRIGSLNALSKNTFDSTCALEVTSRDLNGENWLPVQMRSYLESMRWDLIVDPFFGICYSREIDALLPLAPEDFPSPGRGIPPDRISLVLVNAIAVCVVSHIITPIVFEGRYRRRIDSASE